MKMSDLTLLGFLAFGSIRIVSYVPQMVRIARDANGASAISYTTWCMWTFANCTTALYAGVNLKDPFLALVSSAYALCCIAVISLTAVKRSRHRAKCRASTETHATAEATAWTSVQHLVADEAARLERGIRVAHDFELRLAAQRNRLLRHDLQKWMR
ncbi:MAG: hypothetical protein EKK41_20675 [Hyphomicrobiales bacterium]|nr:MAG: hypothetical protein EKK41_20675 [Hyphomicrobiales bacterium]